MEREETGLELRDYLRVVRRRKWMIVLAVVIVLGTAMTVTLLQTPVYQANAELLLQSRNAESLFNPETGLRGDPARAVQTEIEVLKSEPVRHAVAQKLGAASQVAVRQVGQTDVIQVLVRSTDPGRAAAMANAYAEAYIDFRLEGSVADVVKVVEQIQNKVTELGTQIAEIDRRIAALTAAQRPAQEANLRSQHGALVSQQAVFKQKLDQLQVEKALKSGGAQLVTRAGTPTEPVEPKPVRTAALASVLGLVFGLGLAFLFEYLDDTIKSKDDLARALPEIPVLGMVPAVPAWREREKPTVVAISDPTSAAAEAYRSLRTSIQFMGLDRPLRTMQVTSPNAGEGKTTTLSNLAVSLARAGQRVIVVCCDLRRPRVHEFFWLTNTVGFTSVLLGDVALADAIQSVPGEDRVKLLASGPAPPNPSELLSGRRTVELLTALQSECDIVLIDSPPVLPVTDAAVLSSRVDATLVVATAGSTTQKALHRSYEVLKQVDAPMIGVVLNGVSSEESYGYAYQYRYYSAEPAKSRKERQRSRERQAQDQQPARRI